ncbi:DUF222 domain-containing protein [Microbacterium sp. YY-03]|uniref:HNH endonuclease signature motif containing protein n=1 Tax=Microbacterium sp. YY-03 TaxID=3421636 RepID=UPI003D163491
MANLSDVAELIPTLCGHDASAVACHCEAAGPVDTGAGASSGATSEQYEARMLTMNDDEILAIMQESAAVERQAALFRQIAIGIAVARSARTFGHGGLAAKKGHRSVTSLVQDLLGVSQAEASRQVSVSGDLVDTTGTTGLPDSVAGSGERTNGGSIPKACPPRPWFEPLRVALRAQLISNEQSNTIRKGLGEPPTMPRDTNGIPLPILIPQAVDNGVDAGTDGVPVMVEHTPTIEEADAFDQGARDAWALAAEQLIAEAQVRKINELGAHARYIRDKLDPEGAKRRFEQRYEARAFHITTVPDTGATRIIWTLDDQTALMITAAHDDALRPRRGGPRFVDSAEKAKAKALVEDPRTNAQLASDLMTDIFRAGILADAKSVFGTRQAGVRLVQVINDHGHRSDITHAEDRLIVLPGKVADQQLCDTESIHVTVDTDGNPLNLGRSKRLFTPGQKIALAIRDGGCRWTGCERPASYTEAHHIDPWESGGKTDIDRGILLCQYHHLHCHDNGWHITREGKGEFMLNHPDHPPQPLPPRAPLEYAFKDITLPGPRFRAPQPPPGQPPHARESGRASDRDSGREPTRRAAA